MISKEAPTISARLGNLIRPIVDRDYRHKLVRRHILHPAQEDLAGGMIDAPTFTRLETSLENRKAGKYIDLYATQMLFKIPETIALFSVKIKTPPLF